MSKEKFPHKILWLASYPKSGNTWFRAFLSAIMHGGEVEINKLKTDGIFSSREAFDLFAEISSRDLYDNEVKLMIPDVYRNIAAESDSLRIVKVHDAFENNEEGLPIIPEDVTLCAIYFIRNPLDIAGSLANHMHFDVEHAVNMINNKEACMASQTGNLNKNTQIRQHLLDWSTHVNSWTLNPSFPVCVIRYEDMLENAFETFSKALNFIGMRYTREEILKAISATSFDSLSRQETENGFAEKYSKSPKFFRTGTMGNWKTELSTELAERIISNHMHVMDKFGYSTQVQY